MESHLLLVTIAVALAVAAGIVIFCYRSLLFKNPFYQAEVGVHQEECSSSNEHEFLGLQIELLEEPQSYLPTKINKSLTAALGPVVESFLKDRNLLSSSVRVKFSPEVMKGLKDGTLELTKDASGELLPIARHSGSKEFAETARLMKGGIKLATVASASLQVATILTAQAHLAEITDSLKRIESKLDDIHWFQKEEKRGEIRGCVDLLRQYLSAIESGDIDQKQSTEFSWMIEQVEKTCLGIAHLGKGEFRRSMDKFDELKIKKFTNPKETAKEGRDWALECCEALELIALVQSCRVLGCYVKASLGIDSPYLQDRLTSAQYEVMNVFKALSGKYEDYRTKIVNPLNPSGDWRRVLFYRNHGTGAAKGFREARTRASKIANDFHNQSQKIIAIVDRQEKLATSGFDLDVRRAENGTIEILNVS